MANAARVHAVENGEDLAEYTMIAFGGAAPLHAARLCEKLGIDRLLVPPGAGVGSAIGFLRAPYSFEANRSVYMRLSEFDVLKIQTLLAELESEATEFVRSCDADAPISAEFKVYMRYAGQGEEIPIPISAAQAMAPDADAFLAEFEKEYTSLFGRVVDGMDVEITVWSVNAFTETRAITPAEKAGTLTDFNVSETREIFDPALGRAVKSKIVQRDLLTTGSQVQGPAAITEDETTIILTTSCGATRQPDGCIDIFRHGREVRSEAAASTYDTQGRMLAQAVTGTPGHVNAMAESVGHFMRRIGADNIFEGDVYITNDPWEGTGHLHDITCTAHVVDIGGRGFGADANSVYEEGLYIPIMKFIEKGEVDHAFVNIVRGNVREADQVVGDIYALATCNEVGHRRLIDMMTEFGLSSLDAIANFVLENSHDATVKRIAELPRASAEGEMAIDGFSAPVDLKVKLDIQSDRIVCDFDGTSGLDKKGINVPMVYTRAYACYAIKCAIAPDIPNNEASLAPFEVTAPRARGCRACRSAGV